MKDGYFDPTDVKSARRCMRKWDEFIVARSAGLSGHKLPDAKLGIQPEHGEGYDPITGPPKNSDRGPVNLVTQACCPQPSRARYRTPPYGMRRKPLTP